MNENQMKYLEIKFLGKDSYSRDVYETKERTILKNMELDGQPTQKNMCTSLDNRFDGEPDTPLIYKKQKYYFTVVNEFNL